MDYFLQQLVNGITLGAIYGVLAVGYTMVYGTIGMINFAHGDIYMIGGFISLLGFLVLATLGVTFIPFAFVSVLCIAIAFTALYGWVIERAAYRPLRHAPRSVPLISAIGVSIILQNTVAISQGADRKPLHPIIADGFTVSVPGFFHVTIGTMQTVIVVLTTLLMAAFTYVIRATSFGRTQRAIEQDRTMAALLGVDVDRTISAAFAVGAGLAAVAGLMVTLYYGAIDFSIGFVAGIKAIAAAVLGGLGSPAGAMLGGFLIGLVEAFWSGYFSAVYRDIAVFGILLVVLIFRPFGLLGHPVVEKI